MVNMQQTEKFKKNTEDQLENYVKKTEMVKKKRKDGGIAQKSKLATVERHDHKERLAEINRMKEEQAKEMQRKIKNGIR